LSLNCAKIRFVVLFYLRALSQYNLEVYTLLHMFCDIIYIPVSLYVCNNNEQCVINSHCFVILRRLTREPKRVKVPTLLPDVQVWKLYIGLRKHYTGARDSVVGIATSCRLDVSELETQRAPGMSRMALGSTEAHLKWIVGSF
jgi:hypothetical protein